MWGGSPLLESCYHEQIHRQRFLLSVMARGTVCRQSCTKTDYHWTPETGETNQRDEHHPAPLSEPVSGFKV